MLANDFINFKKSTSAAGTAPGIRQTECEKFKLEICGRSSSKH